MRYGCSCGKASLDSAAATVIAEGVEHRHGLRCRPVSSLPEAVRKAAAEVQAAPVAGGREVLPDLIALLTERSDFGLRKYGTRLRTHNGRDAYLDALQELLDLFVYLHQAQLEVAELRSENAELKAIAAAAQERVDFMLAAGAGGTPA